MTENKIETTREMDLLLTAAAYTKSTDRFPYSAACGRIVGGGYRPVALRKWDGREGWRQGPGTLSTRLDVTKHAADLFAAALGHE